MFPELLPRGAAGKEKPEPAVGSDAGRVPLTDCSGAFLFFFFSFFSLATADIGSFFRWKYCCKLCYWKLISSVRYSTRFILAQHYTCEME